MRPLFAPRERAASNVQKQAALPNCLLAASMKFTTGSAVARDTKDRAARPHLPPTVENQLGRRRQLLTTAQWNVKTLLDREAADRPERRTTLVAIECAKYNDIAALSKTRFSTTWNTLSSARTPLLQLSACTLQQ